MTGLLLPYIYFIGILYSNKIIKHALRKDTIFVFFVFFFVVQIISVLFSFFYPFFTLERFFAIIHNLLAYSFVFLGYLMFNEKQIRDYVANNILKMFYAFALIIFIGAMVCYYFKDVSYIKTIPNWFGLYNKFVNAKLSVPAWHFMKDFPRTMVMSIYPNGTGITLLLVHSIYMNFNFDKSNKYQLLTFLIFILCIFTTGSRAFLVLSLFLLLIYVINTKNKLWLLTLFTPIIIFVSLPFFDYLLSGRIGSNEMRWIIYKNSFSYMLEVNPFFGLGLKPIIPELAGSYPVGSHSTPNGYLIKCGLLGGGLIILAYLFIFTKYCIYLFKLIFSNLTLNRKQLYLKSSFVALLIASFFEDLDAFELLPFYFGMLIWQYFRIDADELEKTN